MSHKRRRRKSKGRGGGVACPKCRSTEVRLRGGGWRRLWGRIMRKHHYSCRRCLIYWSTSRYQQTFSVDDRPWWFIVSFERSMGRIARVTCP